MLFSHRLRAFEKYQFTSAIPLALVSVEFVVILVIQDLSKGIWVSDTSNVQNYLLFSINNALCWTLANLVGNSFKGQHFLSTRNIIMSTTLTAAMYLVVMCLIIGMGTGGHYSIGLLLAIAVSTYVTMLTLRLLLHRLFIMVRRTSANLRKAIILGNTARAKGLSRYFVNETSLSIKYLGFFDVSRPESPDEALSYLGSMDDVKLYCMKNDVSEIYYALDNQPVWFADMLSFADKHFIFLGIVPDIDGFDFTRKIDTIVYNDSRIPVITSRKGPLRLFENYQAKRIFDIVFAASALAVLAVSLFPVIAIAIKLSSEGPVFFKQQRPGKRNKLFWCYKFRTMKVNSDGSKQASKEDTRITRIGALLRKTSLDELPQFYNVLRGDMSVVGPRPNLIVHLEQYPSSIKEYALRHWVTPGITGFAQVSGYRGETKELIQMRRRVEYDLLYIENWSLSLDIEIIGRTILNIVKGEENAY